MSHISNSLAPILIHAFKRLPIASIVSSAFTIVVASFVANNLFNMTWNSFNPSLNSLLLKLFLSLPPCSLSFYSGF